MYLSFTGGPTLHRLEEEYGSPCARPLYCSFDPDLYFPQAVQQRWDLGYMGTYSDDRQPTLDRLLVEPARELPDARMVIAGPQYPRLDLPANVERIEHVPPASHREFYNAQRFTLNVTRRDMIAAGHSPSVRLFEAAASGVPIISDRWDGIETIFKPGEEIFLADESSDVTDILQSVSAEAARAMGERARRRVLRDHTAERRAIELENYIHEVKQSPRQRKQQEAVLTAQPSY